MHAEKTRAAVASHSLDAAERIENAARTSLPAPTADEFEQELPPIPRSVDYDSAGAVLFPFRDGVARSDERQASDDLLRALASRANPNNSLRNNVW